MQIEIPDWLSSSKRIDSGNCLGIYGEYLPNKLGVPDFLSYSELQAEVLNSGITTYNQYRKYRKKKHKVKWPADPSYFYKEEWRGFSAFFGRKKSKILKWEEFVKEIRSSGLKKFSEYVANKKPNWPSQPSSFYKEWKGWKHLVTGVVEKLYKSRDISYNQLKKEVIEKKIASIDTYRKIYKKYKWPAAPNKYKEFLSFYEFFGKKKPSYLSLKDLKKEVKIAKISSMIQYEKYRKEHQKKNWPSSPSTFYKEEFKSNFELFGKKPDYWNQRKIKSYKDKKSLEQIVEEIKKNGVTTRKGYRKNCKKFMWPANPEDAYKDCWKGWDYFFSREKEVELSWTKFKEQARKAKIKNHQDYWKRYKNFKGWPSRPENKYTSYWKGWVDLCEGAQFEHHFRNKMSFAQFKEEVKKTGIKNSKEYREKYKKYNWTSSPPKSYSKEWTNWDDFFDRKVLTFTELKKQVKKEGITGQVEYRKRYKEFKGWASAPEQFYKKEWKDWYDFLSKTK